MKIQTLGHVVLRVRSRARSEAFYHGVLGLPVAARSDKLGMTFFSLGSSHQGSIYKYSPNGSRITFAVLDSGDRPVDLAFDGMGNLYMADLGGKIYKYDLSGILRRHGRTTFGSVPNSAQSLAFDGAGNLFVVDVGDVSGNGNAIYKFTTQGARSAFAKGVALSETLSYVAFQPMPVCCQ